MRVLSIHASGCAADPKNTLTVTFVVFLFSEKIRGSFHCIPMLFLMGFMQINVFYLVGSALDGCYSSLAKIHYFSVLYWKVMALCSYFEMLISGVGCHYLKESRSNND